MQRVSGEPFADYIQAHIFQPLGMNHSTFVQPVPEEMASAMSGGYRNIADGEPGDFEIIPASPAGALSSTGADMALFMNAHLHDGAGLMRPETAREMHETVDQQFPGVNSMLLGFYQENYAGQRIIAHGGDTTFFHSNLSLLMDQDVGVYISLNSGGAGTMGYAVPAAMGAKVSQPDRLVWAIDGDGCFQMTNQELATCTINDIPIKVAIINNSSLGMVRQWQTLFYDGRHSFTDLNTGSVNKDEATQSQGLETALDSGLVPAADLGNYNFYSGRFAYVKKDYVKAATRFEAAKAAVGDWSVIGLP